MKFSKLILGVPFFTLLSFNVEGQVFDSTYWRGWYESPVEVVSLGDWTEEGWWTAGAIVSTGLVLYAQDEEIRNAFQSVRTEQTEWFSANIAEPIGSGLYSLGGSAVLYGVGYFTDDERLQRTSAQAVKAFVLTGGATVVLKQMTHRVRPYEIPRSDLWYGPTGISPDYDAFPSGHTSTAFAVASVYAHSYSDRPWVGVTAYSLASLTALSRIHDDRHWASDVFFGAALGWYVGRAIVQNDSRLTVLPVGSGLVVQWRLD
ncbi:MAG: phosphatase PAP2 family protein [Flavobacteriia bacterium]|nr:phosphatase PAP2 family protein [Flavobacteriia bacterium]